MPRSTTRSGSRSTCSSTAGPPARSPARRTTSRRSASRRRVLLRDGLTGEEFAFAASVVINASGPWTDLTNLALGDPTRYMGGTKGSHIVLDHPELLAATGGRELFFENADGRIVLIYPLKGRVLVGTTDLEHDMADPTSAPRPRSTTSSTSSRRSSRRSRSTGRRSSTASRACARCPATATAPASSRATTASSAPSVAGAG